MLIEISMIFNSALSLQQFHMRRVDASYPRRAWVSDARGALPP